MKFWKRAAAVMVAITLCMGIPAYFPAQMTTPLSVQAADTLPDLSGDFGRKYNDHWL